MEDVEIRYYDDLLGEKEPTISEKTRQKILDDARKKSQNKDSAITAIVEAIASDTFVQSLLPDEFVRLFEESGAAAAIVDEFLKRFAEPQHITPEYDPVQTANVHKELSKFLDTYPRGQTLKKCLNSHKIKYPLADFCAVIMDDEIKNKLIARINITARNTAPEQHNLAFQRNPVQIILNFVFKRVIFFDKNGLLIFHKANMDGLIDLLVSYDFSLEDLYPILYKELKEMARVHRERKEYHDRVAATAPMVNAHDFDPRFLHKDFDFNGFFHRHIGAAIRKRRSNDLPKKLEPGDIVSIIPDKMGQCLLPERAWEPFKKLADTITIDEEALYDQFKNEEMAKKGLSETNEEVETAIEHRMDQAKEEASQEYIDHMRVTLHVDYSPDVTLSNEEVLNLGREHMRESRKQIGGTIEDALRNKDKKDPVRRDCRFIDHIMRCEEYGNFIEWIAYPDRLRRLIARYNFDEKLDESVTDEMIRHQCLMRLNLFRFYRHHDFDESLRNQERNRKNLEEYLKGSYGLELLGYEIISFRLQEEIDPVTKEPIMQNKTDEKGKVYEVPTYDVIRVDQDEPEVQESGEVIENGKMYRLYPSESKRFAEVECELDFNGHDGRPEKRKVKLYIYSGDGHLVHAKSMQSHNSSIFRGNNVLTDDLRLAFATLTPEDAQALKTAYYERHYNGGASVRDPAENRDVTYKAKTRKRTPTSSTFANMRSFDGDSKHLDAYRDSEGKIKGRPIIFEAIIMELEKMLIYFLSRYSITSHYSVYTPEREYKILFQYYFPPAIYGPKFAEYIIQGFRNRDIEKPDEKPLAPPPESKKILKLPKPQKTREQQKRPFKIIDVTDVVSELPLEADS